MSIEHDGPVICSKDGLRVIDCRSCGYAHLDPLPTQADLDAFWEAFYSGDGYKYEQEERDLWYWRRVWDERMREFDRLTPVPPAPWWKAVLDFGAGLGQYVTHVWRNHCERWAAAGYDPNVTVGLVFSKLLTRQDPLRYEAINCSLVLEHILDPLATLRQIHDLLIPGGVLCLIVPNEFNSLQQQLRRYGYSPLYLTHVNYFTPATLMRLVDEAGFEIIRRTATFPIEWFALHGLNYVTHPRVGRLAHVLRMWFETALLTCAPETKRRLYERFAQKGIGREVELWATKKPG